MRVKRLSLNINDFEAPKHLLITIEKYATSQHHFSSPFLSTTFYRFDKISGPRVQINGDTATAQGGSSHRRVSECWGLLAADSVSRG